MNSKNAHQRSAIARIDGKISVVEESSNLLGGEVSLDKNFRTTAAPA
jgi:hypothetical protein